MMTLTVNLIGILIIAAIVWWFWLSSVKAKSIDNSQLIEILVKDGVYSPARIEVRANQNFTLRFIRKDASPCAEKVLFDKLDKILELPLDHSIEITLNIAEAGEYAFTCDMQMYRGSLLVKDSG